MKFALFASTLCRHICFLFGERLDTLLLHRIRKYPDVIGFVAGCFFFHSGERICFFFPDSLSNSPDASGR